jgi:hypothetical protein
MNHITTFLKTAHIAAASLLVFGLTSAQAAHAVDHSQGDKVMSMKHDLAHRSPDIHWPAGFEPEKADLFAHSRPRQTERDARSGAHFAAKRPGIAIGPTFSALTQSQNALAAPEIDFSRGRNR